LPVKAFKLSRYRGMAPESFHVSEHRNTSSSPRTSVISVSEFISL
jgi:hypothetical protein